ncbi:MAG: hypothetical protein KGM24_02000, partial [Elusimicrobia bacterium]|nr:hypothetical protein [Elusimicrobiota bacterium]
VVRRAGEAAPGMYVEHRSWLCNHAVVMHGLGEPTDDEERRFTEVLRVAMRETAAVEPELADEIGDLVRLLIPLAPPETMASVSSSYATMRGAICLSPSDSSVLQIETIIHEFCHQKMNFLLESDDLLEPGQSGQVYFSPWRKDARRLRGLLLGAHAFMNVARHLLRRVRSESFRDSARVDVMRNIALRVHQVDSAMRTLGFHADYTPFGALFAARIQRELGLLTAGVLRFPAGVRAEAAAEAAAHRRFQLGETGLHRPEGLRDRVPRASFATASKSRRPR